MFRTASRNLQRLATGGPIATHRAVKHKDNDCAAEWKAEFLALNSLNGELPPLSSNLKPYEASFPVHHHQARTTKRRRRKSRASWWGKRKQKGR
jgi:hypothetical protein